MTSRPLVPTAPPSVHVRAMITWTAIFPLVSIGFYAIKPFDAHWSPILRAFVLSIVVVPLAVYIVVPKLMKTYGMFLARKNV
ncbi:MAG: hypothetical protein WCO85_06590 [Actinomycetes bacterium]